jgi:hypothetical protein
MSPEAPAPVRGLLPCPGVCVPPGDLDMDALLSATQVARYAGVSVAAVCNWNARGLLPVAKDARGREIRDGRGRPRYRFRDAVRADAVAAGRAKQMAARTTRRPPPELAA